MGAGAAAHAACAGTSARVLGGNDGPQQRRTTGMVARTSDHHTEEQQQQQQQQHLLQTQEHLATLLRPSTIPAPAWRTALINACASPAPYCTSTFLAGVAALDSLLNATHPSPPSLPALLLHLLVLQNPDDVLEFTNALCPATMPMREWQVSVDNAILSCSMLERDAMQYNVRRASVQVMAGGVVVVGGLDGQMAGGLLEGGLAPFVQPYESVNDVAAALEVLAGRHRAVLLQEGGDEFTRAVVGLEIVVAVCAAAHSSCYTPIHTGAATDTGVGPFTSVPRVG